MDNKILVEARNNYGKIDIYVTSEHKDAVNGLTGKKTVNASDMRNLEALGFVVEQVPLLVPIS
tara:strand:- start:741 stop:929 length:189 start_codon:yes stop_codon:yes gene_type:complete